MILRCGVDCGSVRPLCWLISTFIVELRKRSLRIQTLAHVGGMLGTNDSAALSGLTVEEKPSIPATSGRISAHDENNWCGTDRAPGSLRLPAMCSGTPPGVCAPVRCAIDISVWRSEEHTSELQSHSFIS